MLCVAKGFFRGSDGIVVADYYVKLGGYTHMLYYALVFLLIALVAAAFGFGGIAGVSAEFAKILFVVFLVLFVVSLVAGRVII
jgi:uncharacterized membrane protein YtjA (UPF0391 family)